MLQVGFNTQERNCLKIIFNSERDVIGLTNPLDVGKINCSTIDISRKNLIKNMLTVDSRDTPYEIEDNVNTFWERFVSDYEELKNRAAASEPIRIWYSNTSYSLCGLFNVVHELIPYDAPITVVKLPDWASNPRGQLASSWGEVEPENWKTYLSLERALLKSDQITIATKWSELRKEDAPLRILLGGSIHSVNEKFFDCIIEDLLDQPSVVADLIIQITSKLLISEWLIVKSIERLIESGLFYIVKRKQRFYDCIIDHV